MVYSKTELKSIRKDELVKIVQQEAKKAEKAQVEVTRLELIIQDINAAADKLLSDINLPRKFTFWWVIRNIKEIITFVNSIVIALQRKKSQDLKVVDTNSKNFYS